jgi:GAF domain-containing protein
VLIELLDPSVCIEDSNGNVLHGTVVDGERYPVEVSGELIGWVSSERGEMAARLLIQLAQQEVEKTELADEILDLYREVNLLYDLADKLASSLEMDITTEIIVAQVNRIISADHTIVVVSNQNCDLQYFPTGMTLPETLARQLLDNNSAEIVDDVRADQRWIYAAEHIVSMAYTPLRSKERVVGLIVLTNEHPTTYRAADLKLLNTIAAQAAPAIDTALIYQRTTREAAEREARLEQQIHELRIEIDEKRQREKVTEITDSDYFRMIREQSDSLRRLLDNPED